MEKRALGRGLEALLTPNSMETVNRQIKPAILPTQSTQSSQGASSNEQVLQIPVKQIITNKYQPRLDFDGEKLKDLINSIREKGVIQPVLVRKIANGYELIAGERRLRAVKEIGLETIPAIIKNVADLDMLEISLIENIQREGLNYIEEALSFQKFITDFNFTQEKIAQVLGKDRSTIANTIRLLGLPQKIQEYISKGIITMGHAKAILSMQTEFDQLRICTLVVKKGLSVRETENIVASRNSGKKPLENKKDQGLSEIENNLQQYLGTRVRIVHGKKRGKIQIEYYSTEDLNRIIDVLSSKKLPSVI